MGEFKAFRSAIVHSLSETEHAYYFDGLLVLKNGKVHAVGDAAQLLRTLPPTLSVQRYTNSLIVPGFIDTHIHYPQTGMIASYGTQLLEWLNRYAFPTEREFSNHTKASTVAQFFLKELLRNGTTSALVFCSVFKTSVTAFFEKALALNLRMIAGKVMMDRNAPEYLLDTPESSYLETKELIEEWHGKGRLLYAVTPRFAITSSREQLIQAGRLLREYPGVYMQTHLAECRKEIECVAELFPEAKNYLDVYHTYGLTGPKSVFAHCIYLSDEERTLLATTDSSVSFCPTSNLFIGSGLFDLKKTESYGIRVGLGTDVGGGTSFSMLRTISEAYKVLQLQGQNLPPMKSLYLATLGGAKSLHIDSLVGNFITGKEADFVVLDLQATPLMQFRLKSASSIEEKLFAVFTLGDDRSVFETYACGVRVHSRDN